MNRRKTLLLAASACLLSFAVVGRAAEPTLPLKRIVLLNSGVGFFEHRGEVEGDAAVEMKFGADDVNDLLKSLVPQDLGGGAASTVAYGSRDPITKTLETFAINLTNNPTLFDLLAQVRGEEVELETAKKITGTILGVEKRRERVTVGGVAEVVETEYVTLLTEGGLTSVPLAGVQRIRLKNPTLDAELRQALKVLAGGLSNDKKTVSLRFLGAGKRPVRVSYVRETPIWKTSYRLVLADDEPPLLQGWAVVENTGDEDWRDVDLTLASGRPISFIMNLYEPLYVPRPVVEPELFAGLRPQKYGQDLAGKEREFAAKADDQRMVGELYMRRRPPEAAALAAKPQSADKDALSLLGRAAGAVDRLAEEKQESLGRGVVAAAGAEEVGESFHYEIDAPVTLPRGQSAMLPIVAAGVKAEKVSIYDAGVHAKHPLNGLRLTNSTELHLMQGPITVYDGGSYAGDAQIEDLAPTAERLISYALDLDTEVAAQSKSSPAKLVGLKLVRGVLEITNKLERDVTYTVKNSGTKAKKVLVEYPLDPNWKLVEPAKADEKTRDRYRFAVAAQPGKPAELKVREEQTLFSSVALGQVDAGQLTIYIRSKEISEAVRKAVQDVVARQAALAEQRTQHERLQQQARVIEQEQTRIRQNMQQLDRNSELYQRYVKKFADQEDLIEKLRAEMQALQAKIDAEVRSLEHDLSELTIM